jgi:acetyl-CoA carboxylase carboxyl transferase subunit alpha
LKNLFKSYRFQKLKLARHPDRPYALDYVRGLMVDPYEIHGDRHLADDQAIVCFIGYIGTQKVLLLESKKGEVSKIKSKEILVCQILKGIEKL